MEIPAEFIQEYQKIQHFCAGQEQCEFEVRMKLKKRGLPVEVIESIIQNLIRDKFIDNARYSESYIHDHIYIKRWGKLKIKAYLRSKYIPDNIFNASLDSIPEEIYLENLNYLFNRKKNEFSGKISDPKTKAKIFRYLASNGYESDLIFNLEF